MGILTYQEQVVLVLGSILIPVSIIGTLIFLQDIDIELELLLIGGSTVIFSLLIIYTFILQSMSFRSISTREPRQYTFTKSGAFQPTVIPPMKTVKKTITKGICQYCGQSALMGFTCSYCNDYFCADHRLPEKHDCISLRKR